jgi:hypothetical protein
LLGKIGDRNAVPRLLKALKDQDHSVVDEAIFALGKMGDKSAVSDLLKALDNPIASKEVRRNATEALGKIGGEAAIPKLLKTLEDDDSDVGFRSAEALGRIGSPIPISDLWRIFLLKGDTYILSAITAIQNSCKFYNYEIWKEAIQNQKQASLANQTAQPSSTDLFDKLDKIDKRTKQMAGQPKYNFPNAQQVNIIENNPGQVVGVQHNYATDPEVKSAIADLQTLLTQLQTQHPQLKTEAEAIAIIDAEFTEIKRSPTNKLVTLRKQLLNPERHAQAIKATLGEVAKHYLEESVLAKAAITYLDKMSETPDQGA